MVANALAALLRMAFRLLYHQLAWSYDLVAWLVSNGRWQRWTRSALDELDLREGTRVLELGFGPGHLQLEMRKRGIRCLGVDASRQMCRIARRRLIDGPMRLVRGAAEHLPLADGAADVVLATFPAEFIFDPRTLAGCRRVLRRGGKIVFLMGVQPGGFALFDRFLRFIYRVTNQDFQARLGPADFLEQIRAQGFEIHAGAVEAGRDTLWLIQGYKV